MSSQSASSTVGSSTSSSIHDQSTHNQSTSRQRSDRNAEGPSAVAVAAESDRAWDGRAILIGLIVPSAMTILNMSMFGLALPFIRDSFGMEADRAAWLVTAYALPFVTFMPVYGRLGDGLGKRRLFTIGVGIFFVGTALCLLATDVRMLLAGRVVQGMGTAGINPLCIAIISELFPSSDRGRALGTWSATGPATTMIAPFLGGFTVDRWGWQSIFYVGLVAAGIALYVVRSRVPSLTPRPQPGFLRRFDWIGTLLLSAMIISLVTYVSSRAITGVEPLRDWRLLLATVVSLGGLVWWERRHPSPVVPLALFGHGSFARASVAAALRMFLMTGVGFLIPLYLIDIFDLSAMALGAILTVESGALLVTVRYGGRLADTWSRRWPVVIGLSGQTAAMVYFALLPAEVSVFLVVAGLVVYGLGAGLSLAVLHRIAMDGIPAKQSGAAAGLYSTARYFGTIIGPALAGVTLAVALATASEVVDAYHLVFWLLAAGGALGLLTVWNVPGSAAGSE